MILPFELSERQVELVAEALDLLCSKREKSAKHYAKQSRRSGEEPTEKLILMDARTMAEADAADLHLLADKIEALLSADDGADEVRPEAAILCAECRRKGPSMHRSCEQAGCECHCGR